MKPTRTAAFVTGAAAVAAFSVPAAAWSAGPVSRSLSDISGQTITDPGCTGGSVTAKPAKGTVTVGASGVSYKSFAGMVGSDTFTVLCTSASPISAIQYSVTIRSAPVRPVIVTYATRCLLGSPTGSGTAAITADNRTATTQAIKISATGLTPASAGMTVAASSKATSSFTIGASAATVTVTRVMPGGGSSAVYTIAGCPAGTTNPTNNSGNITPPDTGGHGGSTGGHGSHGGNAGGGYLAMRQSADGIAWLAPQREVYFHKLIDAHTNAAELLRATDPDRAIDLLEHAAELEPWNYALSEQIIEIHVEQGQRHAAARRLAILTDHLAHLGLRPSPAIVALAETVPAG